jgi:hypothetical protein
MPPTSKLIRQILGAISEFDKAMTVAKLRGARERKRREVGKCEGRKSHAERNPELVALAKRLHRQKPKGGRMSLRAISAELAIQGFLNENGRPFAAASVKSMQIERIHARYRPTFSREKQQEAGRVPSGLQRKSPAQRAGL